MATPPLSTAKVSAILDAKSRGLTNAQIAKETKTGMGTVSKILKKYDKNVSKDLPGEVNTPVDARGDTDGETTIITPDKPLTLDEMYKLFKIDPKVWVPTNIKTNQWQGFYKAEKVVQPTSQWQGKGSRTTVKHQKVALWQTSVSWKRVMAETMQAAMLELMRDIVKPLPAPRIVTKPGSKVAGDGVMATWGLWDAHLGMYAWHAEVGESMDLTKAVSRVTNSIDDMVEKMAAWPQRIERLLLPIGNDFMHYDNSRQRTTFGEHHLDADGRYAKVFQAGLKCLIYQVQRALDLCENVEVIFVPGNHDMHSGYTLCVALSQRFLNDPRVKFNITPNPRKYVTFGGTLLGFDHGQKATAMQLARIISEECRKEWSASTYREIQVGHIHQARVREFESVTPTNGVKVRVNPALCNLDMYHHESGLIGEPMKSVETQFYSRTGWEGTLVTWARDDHSEVIKKIKLA